MKNIFRSFVAAAVLAAPLAAQAFPIAAAGTEGYSIIVGSTNNIIATYQGNSAAYSNDLYLSLLVGGTPGLDGNAGDTYIFNNHASAVGATYDLGSFAVGSELIFRLHVNNTGYDYFTGAASRNADNRTHARVQAGWQTDTTLVSFEDLFNGPFHYNDLSFSFTNTTSSPTAPTTPRVPEPATLALLGLGLLGAGVARRRAA